MDESVFLDAINHSTKNTREEAFSKSALTGDFQNNISKVLLENFVSHPDGLVSTNRDTNALIGDLSKLYLESVQSLSDTSSQMIVLQQPCLQYLIFTLMVTQMD